MDLNTVTHIVRPSPLADACGIRFHELPFRPDTIYHRITDGGIIKTIEKEVAAKGGML